MTQSDQDAREAYDCLFIVPVFNEAATLEQAILFLYSALEEVLPPTMRWDIVVADNGSHDGTDNIAKKLSVAGYAQAFFCTQKGRGLALREVLRAYPQSTLYCYCDCDIPVEPSSITRLLEPLMHEKADVAVLKRSGPRPLSRRILSLGYRFLLIALFRIHFSDVQAGIKVFHARMLPVIIHRCVENGYFFDTEFIVRAIQKKYRVVEVTAPWIEQRFSVRKSKIHPLKDSLQALKALVRIYSRFHR